MKTHMTGRQSRFQTGLTGSLFRNPTVGSSCLLSLLAHDLCQLAIRRAEVVVKETIPTTDWLLVLEVCSIKCVCACVCVCVCVCVCECVCV